MHVSPPFHLVFQLSPPPPLSNVPPKTRPPLGSRYGALLPESPFAKSPPEALFAPPLSYIDLGEFKRIPNQPVRVTRSPRRKRFLPSVMKGELFLKRGPLPPPFSFPRTSSSIQVFLKEELFLSPDLVFPSFFTPAEGSPRGTLLNGPPRRLRRHLFPLQSTRSLNFVFPPSRRSWSFRLIRPPLPPFRFGFHLLAFLGG